MTIVINAIEINKANILNLVSKGKSFKPLKPLENNWMLVFMKVKL